MKNKQSMFQHSGLSNPIVFSSGLVAFLLLVTGGRFLNSSELGSLAGLNAPVNTNEELMMGQSEVFLVINWPGFPSENAVQLVDPLGAVVATVISPGGRSYSATVSVGCQSDGAGYTLVLTDSQNDGWDGFGPFVRVEDINGNVLLSNVTLPSGQSPLTTSGFTVSGGGAACPTCSDGSQNGNETGVDCGGPDCSPCSTCFDGMQNGNETGVDCGGPDCRACVGPNDICVNVFNDYNSNGAWDGNGELGITGITVTAYDAANTASVFTSSSDGNYVFTPGNADTYRVEVTGIPSDLEPSVAGATTVFFIDRGNKVDVGLHRPAEHFLSSEVIVAVPCYVDGALNGANANEDVLVLSPADDLAPGVGNQSPTEYFIANHNQIGSTFGVAYSRAANSLLSAAFTKRHTAFGPSGTGAIYKIDLNGDRLTQPISSTGVSTLVDLNSLFGANTAGANPHPDAGTDFERDPATYDAVGKIGLGGLAMSETENVLWTINLADRRLYEIPLGGTRENPTAPAAGDISRWPATGDLTGLPGIMGTDLSTNIRPFAVKCYRGDIYIGLVYTAESTVVFNAGTSEVSNLGDRSLLRGYIYKFDPDTDSFSQLLSFPLDYVRGQAVDFCGNNGQAEFYPWTPVYDATAFTTATMGTSRTTTTFPAERVYPQPWITDIEFDEEGKMLIGLRDRFADQHGFNKLPPNAAAASDPNTPFTADGAGDVLVATINTLDNTTYVLENNAQNGTNGGPFGPSAGAGFQEGPGGGEFFFDDRYRPSNAGPDGFLAAPCGEDPAIDEDPLLDPQLQQGHDEITLGGLFVYQGQQQLISGAYDPLNDFAFANNAGFIGPGTDDGLREGASQIYATTVAGGTTFAKGNGLGDLEGVNPPAPTQLGNRLWVDINNNGRQDADEDGLNGVLVELYKETSPGVFTKVAETTTAADPLQGNGSFKFSNEANVDETWEPGFTEVEPEMNYEIRVGLAAVQAADGTITAFSTPDAGGDATNNSKTDLNDSDASPLGVIGVTTGREGQNNHTLDIGVTAVLACSITVNSASPSMCAPATNTYSVDVSVTYADAPVGEDITITTDNGASQTFTPSGVAGTETFTLTNLTSDGVADIDVTATYATTTTCTDDLVDAYTAPANCTPCSITVNSASPSICAPATNTYSVDVSVTYADAPAGEDITITTDNGASQTFTPSGVAGTETFTLTNLTSDGVADIDVTATYATTTTCTDDLVDAYSAPDDCTPCSIIVNSAIPNTCVPASNTYSLTVSVTFANAPMGEDIVIKLLVMVVVRPSRPPVRTIRKALS